MKNLDILDETTFFYALEKSKMTRNLLYSPCRIWKRKKLDKFLENYKLLYLKTWMLPEEMGPVYFISEFYKIRDKYIEILQCHGAKIYSVFAYSKKEIQEMYGEQDWIC